MKIVNHKISIVRGETPIYTASLRKTDGTPFKILSADPLTYYIEFVIRESPYSTGKDSYLFRRYISTGNIFRPIDDTIVEYEELTWNDLIPPAAGDALRIHKMLDERGVYEYRYYEYAGGGQWLPYSFGYAMSFPYSETKEFEPKNYFYEVNLIGGTPIDPAPTSLAECPITISKKINITPPREFKVEASIGA